MKKILMIAHNILKNYFKFIKISRSTLNFFKFYKLSSRNDEFKIL